MSRRDWSRLCQPGRAGQDRPGHPIRGTEDSPATISPQRRRCLQQSKIIQEKPRTGRPARKKLARAGHPPEHPRYRCYNGNDLSWPCQRQKGKMSAPLKTLPRQTRKNWGLARISALFRKFVSAGQRIFPDALSALNRSFQHSIRCPEKRRLSDAGCLGAPFEIECLC